MRGIRSAAAATPTVTIGATHYTIFVTFTGTNGSGTRISTSDIRLAGTIGLVGVEGLGILRTATDQ